MWTLQAAISISIIKIVSPQCKYLSDIASSTVLWYMGPSFKQIMLVKIGSYIKNVEVIITDDLGLQPLNPDSSNILLDCIDSLIIYPIPLKIRIPTN